MKKILSILLVLAMVVSLLPAELGGMVTVRASVTLVNNFDELRDATSATGTGDEVRLTASFSGATQLNIERNVTLNLNGHTLTITVSGNANGIKIGDAVNNITLTIMDGAGTGELIVTNNASSSSGLGNGAAINTTDGELIIESGIITAHGGDRGAGIGGGINSSGGNITINGGTVVATGGSRGAGIGGGAGGNGGFITINGGNVEATGGRYGAGIGGGTNSNGGSITINGGDVITAIGGDDGGAGIGGGWSNNGGTIEITGGEIEATGNGGGAGIGGGLNGDGGTIEITDGDIIARGGSGGADIGSGAGIGGGTSGDGGVITINGGTVKATGGDGFGGAGIGGGGRNSPASIGSSGGEITINDGEITAQGGSGYGINSGSGAGIGGGNGGDGGIITINGGTVKATGGSAGIGGGAAISGIGGNGGEITITGGEITATGGRGAGIGGSVVGSGGTITIEGGEITAQGGLLCAGIGSGDFGGGIFYGNGGNITITGGNITAEGGNGGAGIGGGRGSDGGEILIVDGEITATGDGGAGIGGGDFGDGGIITIEGGKITAEGGNGGAGIGGGIGSWGAGGDGGEITITGGEITVTGGGASIFGIATGGGAGIGGGMWGNSGTIMIDGGEITATGSEGGAGIGVGDDGNGGDITITGGSITASTSTADSTRRAIDSGSSGTVEVLGEFNYWVNTSNTEPTFHNPPNEQIGTLDFNSTTTFLNDHHYRYIRLVNLPPLYTVTVESVGVGATGGGLYAAGVDVPIFAGEPPLGQVFLEWEDIRPPASPPPPVQFEPDNVSSNATFEMPARNVTVRANFATVTYTTRIEVPEINNNAPNVNPITNPAAASEGTTVNLPYIEARTGFVFVRWEPVSGITTINNATSPDNASFEMGTENVVINAVFEAATLTFGNQSLTPGTFNTPYSASVTAPTGGSGSYSYSAVLPAGLDMDSSGAISGTPNAVVTNATFTVTVVDTVSGATADAEYTLTVNPGVFTGTPNINYYVQTGLADTYSVSLGGLAAGENFGTISGYTFGGVLDSLGIVNGIPSISGGTLSVSVNDIPQGTIGTATINITMHTQNYGNVSATVTLILTDKTQVIITANAADTIYTGLPYAGLSGISASGGLDSVLLEIMFAGRNTTAYSPSASPPVDAGDYSVTISVPSDNPTYFGSEIFNFSVSPAALYISVNDITVQTGETPVFTYTVTGMVNNETAETALTSPPTVESPTADINTAGTYPIVISGGTASANYHIAERVDGTLTVVAPTDTPEITPPPTTYIPIEIRGSVVLGDPARTPRETPATEPEEPETIETEEETETFNRAQLQIGSNLIICLNQNTVLVEMDTVPVIQDGRTLIPLRFVANILGAHVSWNEATREVTLTKGDRVLILPIGTITPELAALGMDVPPTITDGRTMVPLRFISEFFGATVLWDETERSIEIIF